MKLPTNDNVGGAVLEPYIVHMKYFLPTPPLLQNQVCNTDCSVTLYSDATGANVVSLSLKEDCTSEHGLGFC